MIAEIIAVGSEMLTPFRQDTNSLHVTAGLNDLGVSVAFKTVVGDNPAHLTAAIQIALARVDVLVLSGGLGPTEDDLTRNCVANALGIELHRDPDLLVGLVRRFAERRMTMPSNNERQAEVLEGAEILPNAHGSAPGQWLDVTFPPEDEAGHRKVVILLPGPPKELKPLFDEQCLPRLKAVLPARHLAKRLLRIAVLPESQVDARVAPIYRRFEDVETTILAGGGEIQLHFLCVKPTPEEAEARVNEAAYAVEREMGDEIFSSHGESLEEVVLLMLGLHGQTVALAESCTGGMIAARLTAVPKASRSVVGGVVAYTAEVKERELGVPEELIRKKGAVSEEVARAMAEGVQQRMGTSLGLSVTGLAGPDGGTGADAGKQIGLVFVGVADGEDTQVRRVEIRGDRERVRLFAAMHALEMLRKRLL